MREWHKLRDHNFKSKFKPNLNPKADAIARLFALFDYSRQA